MATTLYSVSVDGGFDRAAITKAVGSAVVTAPIELTVDQDSAAVVTKESVLRALEKLTNFILTDGWPPV
jgi:hypothetical protein